MRTNNVRIAAISLLLLAVNFLPSVSFGQAKTKEVVAGVGSGILAIGMAALEYDQFLEKLEFVATQHVIATRPEENAFKVKVLSLENRKITDVSNMSCLVFSITFYDQTTQDEKSREVLFAFLSPGWMSEYGIEYTRINWQWFNQNRWNLLYSRFVDIACPVEVEGTRIPVLREIQSTEFLGKENQILINRFGKSEFKLESYYERTGQFIDVAYLSMKSVHFELSATNFEGANPNFEYLVPIYSLGRDQYLTGSFDKDLSLVVNEGSMGIYLAGVSQLTQIPRTTLHTAHSFVNEKFQGGPTSNLQAVAAARNYRLNTAEGKQKTSWAVGDQGFYEASSDLWVPCTVVSAELKSAESNEWLLRITFQDRNVPEQRNILSSSERLAWPVEKE
jgi:hypothetical protein